MCLFIVLQVDASQPVSIPKTKSYVNFEVFDQDFERSQAEELSTALGNLSRQPSVVIEEDDGSGSDSDEEQDFFGPVSAPTPTPSKRPVALPASLAKSVQPVQPFQVQKISLQDYQIPNVVQQIQDNLLLSFTGSMTPDEVAALLKRKEYTSYDDATIHKLSYAIAYNLQDLEGLADVLYQSLLQRSDFGFRSTDNTDAKERYLKNYLRMRSKGAYISDELTKALMQRFEYETLKKDEFLKYANNFYVSMMKDPNIDAPLSLKLDRVKETVEKHFQYSSDPEIVKLRHRVPLVVIQNNVHAQNDVKKLIDFVAKKIALPARRQPEDLGKKLEERSKQLRPNNNRQ